MNKFSFFEERLSKMLEEDKLLLIGIISLYLVRTTDILTLEVLTNKIKNFNTVVTFFRVTSDIKEFVIYLNVISSQNNWEQNDYLELLSWLLNRIND